MKLVRMCHNTINRLFRQHTANSQLEIMFYARKSGFEKKKILTWNSYIKTKKCFTVLKILHKCCRKTRAARCDVTFERKLLKKMLRITVHKA